jgi:hypothetical protein
LPPPGPDGSARHAESVCHLAEIDPARPDGDLASLGSPPGPGHSRNLLPDQADRARHRGGAGVPRLTLYMYGGAHHNLIPRRGKFAETIPG